MFLEGAFIFPVINGQFFKIGLTFPVVVLNFKNPQIKN